MGTQYSKPAAKLSRLEDHCTHFYRFRWRAGNLTPPRSWCRQITCGNSGTFLSAPVLDSPKTRTFKSITCKLPTVFALVEWKQLPARICSHICRECFLSATWRRADEYIRQRGANNREPATSFYLLTVPPDVPMVLPLELRQQTSFAWLSVF